MACTLMSQFYKLCSDKVKGVKLYSSTNMFSIPDWPNTNPNWNDDTIKLLTKDQLKDISHVSFKELVQNSEKFAVKFPVCTIQCKYLNKKEGVPEEVLQRNINSTYPIIHEKVLELCAKFILLKREHGTDIEKRLYENLGVVGLINRLLFKRAIMFMGRSDIYMVGEEKGRGIWETIGTKHERPPLTLDNCISYDEIKLSAFLYVTSFTHFLNDGSRHNSAIPEKNREILEKEGIIIGLIGARFEKEKVMEYEDCIVSMDHQIEPNSVGQLFHEFYEEPIRSYREVTGMKDGRYVDLMLKYFDNTMFAKRLSITFDTLLLEANTRARSKNTTAFIHMVGIGLGVWKISSHQRGIFLETFLKRIQFLSKSLCNISDINFAYLGKEFGPFKHGDLVPLEDHPEGGIRILMTNREPHLKLTGCDEGKLLVVTYAWDGNALPGNEFWGGSLAGSGDPAAACSTQIAELHNAHINPKVCAENLYVATTQDVISLKEYVDYLIKS